MKKSILAIDVGNTHTVAGLYQEQGIRASWRLQTKQQRTADEYWVQLLCLAQAAGLDLTSVGTVALASVVPQLSRTFTNLTNKYLNASLLRVNHTNVPGLTYPVDDPSHVGADLLVNAYAAVNKYHTNCIICDLGTATTIQLVGADGHFYGTAIAPGVNTAAKNLIDKAAKLSQIELGDPDGLLALNTKDALLSGIIHGNALMLDGFISKIRVQYKHLGNIMAIATGGVADLVGSQCQQLDKLDHNLTLDGLWMIARATSGENAC